jgi:hypothetical protein
LERAVASSSAGRKQAQGEYRKTRYYMSLPFHPNSPSKFSRGMERRVVLFLILE